MLISNFITRIILNRFRRLNHFEESDIDVIRYSLESVLWEVEKTVLLFIAFAIIGYYSIFLITLIAMISIRTFAGGYHSESSLVCLIISYAGFFLSIFILPKLNLSDFSILVLSIFSLVVSLCLAPMGSLERQSMQKAEKHGFVKGLVIVVTLCWLIFIYLNRNQSYVIPILWIIVLQNIQLVFEYIRRERKRIC